MMKRSIIAVVLIGVFSIFHGSGVYAEQIVLDKDGKAVRLKDDHTWEFIDTSKEKGKVVFSIAKAEDVFNANRENKDDMGDVKNYSQFFGCEYYFTIENKTSYKVRIGKISVGSTLVFDDMPAPKKIYSNSSPAWGWKGKMGDGHFKGEKYVSVSIDKLVKPGEKIVWEGGLFGAARLEWYVGATKQPINDDKIKEYIKKFGCSGQNGTVYLRKIKGKKFITFSKKSGILSDEEISKFVVGSVSSAAPLKEEIFWFDKFGKQNW